MPRAGLTPERVVEGAAALADEVGYDGLSLTGVADHFRVAVPSLYKHVGGLDDLRHRVAVHAATELGARMATAAADAGPGSRLRALAHAYRDYAQAHPGRYAATVRAPDPDDEELTGASDRVLTIVLSALRERGVEEEDLVHAARSIRAALHGFVTLETAGGFGLPEDVDRSFEHLVEVLLVGLTR